MMKHPLSTSFLLVFGAWLFYTYGIGLLSSPIPASLVRQYMGITLGVVLLYMAADSERWQAFQEPIWKMLSGENKQYGLIRNILFVLLPLYVGWMSYQSLKPQTTAPPLSARSTRPTRNRLPLPEGRLI